MSNPPSADLEIVRCNLCGSDQTTELSRRARWGQAMTNVVCRRCGLVYATPRLTRGPLDRFYREWVYPEFLDASGQFTRRLLESSRKEAAETFRYFGQGSAESMHGRRLLEIGCGLGDFLTLARNGGAEVLGVEMEGLYAAHAEQAGLPIVRDYIETFPLDRTYDVIAMFHVLEHLEDPKATLTALRPYLDPGGHLFLEVPNFLGPWRIPVTEFLRVEHLYNFSLATLEGLLHATGYRIVARDSDPFVLRVRAVRSNEKSADRDLSGHHDEVLRHIFRWRVRARVFQPYYALRRLATPDARRR